MSEDGNDMVERVAKALAWAARFYTDVSSDQEELWAAHSPEDQEMMRSHARAAIAAMREPTEAMTDAGSDAEEKYEDEVKGGDLTPTRHDLPAAIWRAMADAALGKSNP